MTDFFEGLEDDVVGGEFKPATKGPSQYDRVMHKCDSCNGTGLWNGGRLNSHGNAKCNTCHGTGVTVHSPADRKKQRASRAKTKANKAQAAREANRAHGDGFLLRWLDSIHEWNNFANSLIEQHAAGKAWSDKQVESCRNMYKRMEEKKAAKAEAAAVREAAAPSIDLQPIRDMFDLVVSKGFKRPKYRAEGFIISLAPAHGVNAGALYVKSEADCYMGKLVGTKFHGSRDAEGTDVQGALEVIAADPLGAAVRYGNATGTCACCGRALTNHASIERGIGPVCADRWGLGDAQSGFSPKMATKELNTLLK